MLRLGDETARCCGSTGLASLTSIQIDRQRSSRTHTTHAQTAVRYNSASLTNCQLKCYRSNLVQVVIICYPSLLLFKGTNLYTLNNRMEYNIFDKICKLEIIVMS